MTVRRCAMGAVLALLSTDVRPAQAVILTGGTSTAGGGTGTNPLTAPIGSANVGYRTDGTGLPVFGSAIYLGNNYVLTAGHVGAGGVSFDGGTTIFAPTGPGTTILNSDSSATDMVVYQINGTPVGLTGVTIASTTPPNGTLVDMIGFGRDRIGDTPTTITTTSGPKNGYFWDTTHTKRYGTNNIDRVFPSSTFGTTALSTDYDETAANDAQATEGDSGGAVFNSTTHELVGMMFSRLEFVGQQANSSAFGNVTLSADLATYRNQIIAATPEPGSVGLIAVVAAAGLLRRRRSTRGAGASA